MSFRIPHRSTSVDSTCYRSAEEMILCAKLANSVEELRLYILRKTHGGITKKKKCLEMSKERKFYKRSRKKKPSYYLRKKLFSKTCTGDMTQAVRSNRNSVKIMWGKNQRG